MIRFHAQVLCLCGCWMEVRRVKYSNSCWWVWMTFNAIIPSISARANKVFQTGFHSSTYYKMREIKPLISNLKPTSSRKVVNTSLAIVLKAFPSWTSWMYICATLCCLPYRRKLSSSRKLIADEVEGTKAMSYISLHTLAHFQSYNRFSNLLKGKTSFFINGKLHFL